MPSLALVLGEVTVRVSDVGRRWESPGGPYRDWLDCDTQMEAGTFRARVLWSVMSGELLRLADELERLYDSFPEHGAVEFAPTEPNLRPRPGKWCNFRVILGSSV